MLKRLTCLILVSLVVMMSSFALASAYDDAVTIPAGSTRSLKFHLSWGDTVKGKIWVSGDPYQPGVDVKVSDPYGNTMLDLGRVTVDASIEFSGGFMRGEYSLHLLNPSSLSGKTVNIGYDIETNPLMRYNYEIITILIVVVVIIVANGVRALIMFANMLSKWAKTKVERFRV